MRDMSTDKKREEAKRKQELQALQEKADWDWLLADERGRRILYRTLGFCGIHRSVFEPNAMKLSFLEGQRNVGLYLWDKVARYVPNRVAQMIEMRDSDA
jgi:hypothetical protein